LASPIPLPTTVGSERGNISVVCLSVMLKVLRVTQEYMYAMFGILFVLALGLKDELLEDVVIPCNNTADSTPISTSKNTSGV
jgi:hypothetical protein